MDLYKLILSAKLVKGEEGGGGDVDVEPLNVVANGTYSASGKAYSPVTVSVPTSGITPTGTINIVNNGAYDVGSYASANVSVPTGITPSGTKNIEANGDYDVTSFASAHVAVPSAFMEAITITENGTYVPSGSVSGFNQVTVSVSGGGGGGDLTFDEVAMHTFSGTVMGNASAISEYAFRRWNMVGANFPSATSIGSNAFSYCANLTTVDFPAATTIGTNAFAYCSNLTTVDFPAATTIGSNAFQNCYSLTTVDFPAVTSIGSYAFQNCNALESIYFRASTVAALKANVFTSTPMSVSTYLGHFGSIYVPASLVSDYKTANNWSAYADRITAIVE